MANTMTIEEFKSLLSQGKVYFGYYKVHYYTRAAVGTTNPELIPEDKLPKGTGSSRKANPGIVKYYDLEKQAWRSFVFENLICVGKNLVDDNETMNACEVAEVERIVEEVAEKMEAE